MTDDPEIDFYRRVEELFAVFRGAPHVLSPRDFQLLRRWWQERVPLAAVQAGLDEIAARRHQRGDTDPVVSLSYCRHAVARHARRLAEMRVGADVGAEPGGDAAAAAARELAELLAARAEALTAVRPAVAEILTTTASAIRDAAALPPAALDERLFDLEGALLAACWQALAPTERDEIEAAAEATATATATGDAVARTVRALCDRELRRRLELPRLELVG